MRVALERARLGNPAKSVLMVGLRGVGKTVLLDRMRDDAEASGIQSVRIEAPESRSLPALLAPELRQALLRLSRNQQARAFAERALRGLAGNGDLEHDLQALVEVVGQAAKSAGTALVLFIDELQYVEEEQLAALITALHRAAQRKLPVVLVGAGLPQLRGQTGRAKSYAERLFDFPEVGSLRPIDAGREALPARHVGARARTASLGGHRRRARQESHGARPDAKQADRQGHDLEPESRGYGFHGTPVRRVHATRDAGKRLASELTKGAQLARVAPPR